MQAIGFFLITFLSLFILGFIVHTILNLLNQKYIRKYNTLPDFFKDRFDEDAFVKSRSYSLEHLRFDWISLAYSNILTLIFLFSGMLPWLKNFLDAHTPGPLTAGVGFFGVVLVAQSLLQMPFSLYETFRIEGKYGFNTLTWKLYISDLIKGSVLTVVIGIPILYGMLAFIAFTGSQWWLWLFLFLSFIQLFMLVIYPIWISPWFNKFKPLEEGPLKQALLDMACRAAFGTRDIYIMDGSRRSTHSNAYFTGFGKWRRIVLYDTLVAQMSIPELTSVLAHEIGHYKKKHIYKSLILHFAGMALMLFIFSRFLNYRPMYQSFGFSESSHAVGLYLFFSSISVFSFLISPWRNQISRKHEYEADAFSVDLCKDKVSMQNALIKLAQKNLSNLTPHPWYSAFYYSHPTIFERIKAMV